jgi:hypothetical protein
VKNYESLRRNDPIASTRPAADEEYMSAVKVAEYELLRPAEETRRIWRAVNVRGLSADLLRH